jgi:RNA polymerase sigma factor for flagellar operon FliA
MTRLLSWESLSEPAQERAQSREDSAETHAESAEQKRLLADAITQLPERQRLVVTLYYLEDLRLKEIGQVLKLSESRVSRLLSSALFTLGEHLRMHEA